MQKALEGSAKIVILATISQSSQCYDESLNTITFASKAKNIVQIVHRNKTDPGIDPLIKQAYEAKILALERKIWLLEKNSPNSVKFMTDEEFDNLFDLYVS